MRDHELIKELIGDSGDSEIAPPKVIFPYRLANRIELHLEQQQMLEIEMIPLPLPIIEDDVLANADDFVAGETLTYAQAVALRGMFHKEIADKYHRQKICARELGDDSTATLADYLLLCAHDGIEPYPNGVHFTE